MADPRVTQPGLSLVLPAFNEEENVQAVVTAAVTALQKAETAAFEVLLVDDGSRDDTAAIALRLAAEHPGLVRVVQHERNIGYGAAIRTGWLHARYDVLAYTDADGQFDVAEIAHLLPLLQQADLVTGFRVYRYDTVLRSIVSWCYNKLVWLLFGVRVRDVDCAMKVIRASAFDQLALESTDFFIDTELLARARRWGYVIAEKGIRHYPRAAGETTVQPSDVPRTLRTVFHMWRRIHLPTRLQLEEGRAANERLLAMSHELQPDLAAR